MNKIEKSKILNYCIQNTENLFFSQIKEIDVVKKNKKFRYMDNDEISSMIISFYFDEVISKLQLQKKKNKKHNQHYCKN